MMRRPQPPKVAPYCGNREYAVCSRKLDSLLRRVQIATPVSLAEHLVQMSLSVPQTAVHGLSKYFRFLVSGSRPVYTRTSHIRAERRTI